MDKIIDISAAFHSAVDRLDAYGGFRELKERYPARLQEVMDALDANWTVAGVAEWEEAIMRGLKKIKGEV